jgi:hypothetical protein
LPLTGRLMVGQGKRRMRAGFVIVPALIVLSPEA